MVQHTERFKAFVKLGSFLRDYADLWEQGSAPGGPAGSWQGRLKEKVELAAQQNSWFTAENIRTALTSWGEALREVNLARWVSGYQFAQDRQKKVAIIMAGNIPLVGLHDLLSVLITGNKALIKTSSDDRVLLPFLAAFLGEAAPGLKEAIVFAEGPLKGFDAVIATGSNNTARYFEYYFGKKPHIIRKNRNSVAVLEGDETKAELNDLGRDIFTYFGLGCRNVAKLYVPDQYDFDMLFKSMAPFSNVADHRKYANNYEYNKAVFLMSNYKFLDNGFLLLLEDTAYASPIGTLHFECYTSVEDLQKTLENDKDLLQCMVGKATSGAQTPFGQTQYPALWEYADGIDTVHFLLKT